MVLVSAHWSASVANAVIVAECGFNDAAGINADPVADSPYKANATTLGRGAGEPGWTGTWTGSTGDSNFVAQPNVFYEGDLALRMRNTSSGLAYSTMREYADQAGIFYLDLYVRATDLAGNPFSIYTGPNSWNAINVATHIAFEPDGSIVARDGGLHENTGFGWTPSQWTRITEEINVPVETYRLWVNGQEYLAPDPLNFRHSSGVPVDDVRFLLTAVHSGDTPSDVYVDAIRILDTNPIPEPSGLSVWSLLGAIGITVGWWRRRRRAV